MKKSLINDYNYIISYTTTRIQTFLNKLSIDTIEQIQEIRIRANRPIVIVLNNECLFLNNSGKLSSIYSFNCIIASQNDITETVNKMCGYSLHSHYEDMLNGYITLPNGSRIGLTGTAVFEKANVKGIKDIDGINIRIPRRIVNFSSAVFEYIYKNKISNLLIAGPPSSGKTTMLKDLTYQLSSGKLGKNLKVCIIDERKEITNRDKNFDDIGLNTDVLYGYPKSIGISMAVRCLSPDVIICDEVSSEDTENMIKGMNSGVVFIFTIHATNYEELIRKNSYQKLYNNGCIEDVLFINSFNRFTIVINGQKKEVNYETNYNFNDNCFNDYNCNKLC